MSIEAYFAAPEGGTRQSVTEFVRLLSAVGCPCKERPDEWGHWVLFDGRESTLNFSISNGAATFATFDMASDDPPEFFEKVECVFRDAGWRTGEEDDC